MNDLKNKRNDLLQELSTLKHVLHGSWVERYSVCSKKNCKCRRGQKHGPRRYLVINENGKQKQKYIPNSQVDIAKKGIQEYKRMQDIIMEITKINLQLIKGGNYDAK